METKTILLAGLVGLSLMAPSARAQIIASDDFSYPDGNLNGANGGSGWSGAWNGNSYGTPTVSGGQAVLSSSGTDAHRVLSSAQGPGTVAWLRFAGQQFTTAAAGVTNGTFGGLHVFNGGSAVALIGKAWPGPYRWTLIGGSAQVSAQSTLSASVLYARITTTTTNTMIFDLWVNPANPGLLNTVTPDASQMLAGNGWDTVYLRAGSGESVTESWKFDNLAIGATLADVVDHPTLPMTLPGPIFVGSGASPAEPVVFAAAADSWLGTNYGASSSRTLYTRFSMAFNNLNNGDYNFPSSLGGLYGGLEFFQGTQEHLLVGAGWGDESWSAIGGGADLALNPNTIISSNEWHTMVVRTDYSPNNNADVKVWLDPDFTQTEASQPNGPVEFTMANSFDSIHLRCGNGPASATFSNLVMAATSTGVGFKAPADPQFQGFVPGANATFVAPATPIAVQVLVGGVGIRTNAIFLTLDGNAVTPTFAVAGTTISVTYQSANPLAAGSSHSVSLNLTDMNGTAFSTSWSFTVDPYPALPVNVAGPLTVSGGGATTLFTSQNGWLAAHYGANSTNVLYTRFSMTFTDVNNGGLNVPNAGGGCYGGLQFFQGGSERLLVGDGWADVNWSLGASVPNQDLAPVTPILTGETHIMVIKSAYVSGGNTVVKVWLDPDFTKTEDNQPHAPILLSTDNTFDNIRFRCGNGSASANFSDITLAATATGVGFALPVGPQFQSFVPDINATYVSPATPIGVQVVVGGVGIRTNAISLTLDGGAVTPTFAVSGNTIAVNYQPASPLAPGSAHSVALNLTDMNGTPYARSWSFTVDPYPALPVTLAGPFTVSGGGYSIILNSQNQGIGSHYGPTSTNVLYTRFSMEFTDVNNGGLNVPNAGGGCYGGLQFWQGGNQKLLVGAGWADVNWSIGASVANQDLSPVTPIVAGAWHTMVVRSAYAAGASTAVKIWLDPDFSKSEGNQPNPPLVLSTDNTFDNIMLRCGNGTASAEFTNVVIAATAPGVGFAAAASPATLAIQDVGGKSLRLSWTSTGTLQEAPAVTGAWTDSVNQANPQTRSATNSALFFRLKQ